jgi:hypothetical protein
MMHIYFEKISKLFRQSRFAGLLRIVILIILVGIGIGVYFIYRALNPVLYVATADNFKINFPGKVTVNTIPSSSDGSGGTEGGRIYEVVNTGNQPGGYIVYVIHYSDTGATSLSKSDTEAALELDTQQLATVEKATISKHALTTFNGLTAVTATLVPTGGADGTINLLAFLKQHNVYVILGSNLSQSKFDKFTASFRFLN